MSNRGGLLGLALVASTAGCVVLSDPEFKTEDQCPPTLDLTQASPTLASQAIIAPVAGRPFEFRATVPIESCALTRVLEMRVFLDGFLAGSTDLPPNGTSRRDASLAVDLTRARQGCHVVELLVSGRFSSDPGARQPAKAGDIGYAVWKIGVVEDASKELPSLRDCDKGLP